MPVGRFLAVVVGLLGVLGASPVQTPFQPFAVPGTDIRLLPECERNLKRVVLGLSPNQTKHFMLPETGSWNARTRDPRVLFLRRQLYWLNFELLHGGILKAAPRYTEFYFAVPDPRVVTSSFGNEEPVLREYLHRRIGWSSQEISRRAHFFRVPEVMLFPRDIAEPLGRDSRERLVLAIGADSDSWYADSLEKMVRAFPNDFLVRILPEVNTEGGDLSLAWLPDGNMAVLVGYHRILRYEETKRGVEMKGERMDSTWIASGKDAFRRAFFGLEVLVVGEENLREPKFVNDELFHLDMVVNVLKGSRGVVAFVPSYTEPPVDAMSHVAIAASLTQHLEREYDRVAAQLAARGYRVVRLPFRDHPDRTPVQVADFVDAETGRPSLLLGKYPYHLELPGGRNPQRELQQSLHALESAVEEWRQSPTGARWQGVRNRIAFVWRALDTASKSPNPNFEMQARIYESEGVRVIPVPIVPTGEGGIHCLLLN